MPSYLVIVTDETADDFRSQLEQGVLDVMTVETAGDGTAEGAVMALLEVVPIGWLDHLKLHSIGRIQARRVRAEREMKYRDN